MLQIETLDSVCLNRLAYEHKALSEFYPILTSLQDINEIAQTISWQRTLCI